MLYLCLPCFFLSLFPSPLQSVASWAKQKSKCIFSPPIIKDGYCSTSALMYKNLPRENHPPFQNLLTLERKDSLETHLAQKVSCLVFAYLQLSHSHACASFNIRDLTPPKLPFTSMYFVNMTLKHSNIFIWEIRENLQKLI